MHKRVALTTLLSLFLSASVNAATVNVDLNSVTTGDVIINSTDGATGAAFAGTFDGQTIDGEGVITGIPNSPLDLAASNFLEVALINPEGVSPTGNSIVPEVDGKGPLSILLDSLASSITLTIGKADNIGSTSSLTIDFFGADGGDPVKTVIQSLNTGYDVYTFDDLGGNFRGLTISNNTDALGLGYMNISYNTVVPVPAAFWLFSSGLLGLVGMARRKK